MGETSTGVGAALAFASENLEPKIIKTSDTKPGDVLLVPSHMEAIQVTRFLDKLLPYPRRKTGTFTLETLASFIEIVNNHKSIYTDIFAQASDGQLTAIFNSHGLAENNPQWGDFRAVYKPAFSAAWKAWTKVQPVLSTADFAAFIDDHIQDVDVPPIKGDGIESSKALLELAKLYGTTYGGREELMVQSRGLKIHVKDEITEEVNTSTGEVELAYKSTHNNTVSGKLKLPGMFCITIPVFDRGDAFRLPVRLKYRPVEGKVLWSLTVLNTDKTLDTVIDEMILKVHEQTTLKPFMGSVQLPGPKSPD